MFTQISARGASLSAGALDPEFGVEGKAWIDFPRFDSTQVTGVVAAPDGGIWLSAKLVGVRKTCFGLARLNSDGSVDPRFGVGGYVSGCFEEGFDAMAGGLQQLPDGRLLVVGLHYASAHLALPALAMFHPNGDLDGAFGTGGMQVVRLPQGLSGSRRDGWLPPGIPGVETCAARVQADGRVVLVTNHHFELADQTGVLICLAVDGRLDPGFNGRGFLKVHQQRLNTWLSDLYLTAEGHIVVAGSCGMPPKGLLACYRSDGSLMHDFGEGGFRIFSALERGIQLNRVLQSSDGRLYGVGHSRHPISAFTMSYSAWGHADMACNEGRAQLTSIGHSGCRWLAVAEQAQGYRVTAGSTIGGGESDVLVARFHANGDLDSRFGAGAGWVRTCLGKSQDVVTAIAVQPDRKIVVGGYSLRGQFRGVLLRYIG